MKTRYVYLGRFAPFHNGHRALLSRAIEKWGADSVLLMIGSTNTLNKRTPYTYEDRRLIIRASFPNLEILPIPDGKPNLEHFDGSTNGEWLDSIDKIALEREERFVFLGGSKEDLEVLSERFETIVLIDRTEKKISATEVREMIKTNNTLELKKVVDPSAIEIIIERFKKFI